MLLEIVMRVCGRHSSELRKVERRAAMLVQADSAPLAQVEEIGFPAVRAVPEGMRHHPTAVARRFAPRVGVGVRSRCWLLM